MCSGLVGGGVGLDRCPSGWLLVGSRGLLDTLGGMVWGVANVCSFWVVSTFMYLGSYYLYLFG